MTVIDLFERELNGILNELGKNPDVIQQAFSAADIRANQERGIMSAVLTIEGPAGFGFDPSLLGMMHAVGFRISTLGWNEDNPLTGSHKTGNGLTELGREYVKECQNLGFLVDVSHISDAAFWDIMEMTQAPVIATHSNSRAVWDPRCRTRSTRSTLKTPKVIWVSPMRSLRTWLKSCRFLASNAT